MFDQDDIQSAIDQEYARLNSPLEDIDFLNDLDRGYIGYTPPEVRYIEDEGKELWVIEGGKVKKKYIPAEELDEYKLEEGDNDPASAEQAWA